MYTIAFRKNPTHFERSAESSLSDQRLANPVDLIGCLRAVGTVAGFIGRKTVDLRSCQDTAQDLQGSGGVTRSHSVKVQPGIAGRPMCEVKFPLMIARYARSHG